MNLTEVIAKMHETHSPEDSKAFSDMIRTMADGNEPVYVCARRSGSGFAIDTAEHSGCTYCIMYSNSSLPRSQNNSMLCTIGLSNLTDSVYANPHLAGLVIDPYTSPVYIQRKDLQVVTGKPDPRQQPRNWGEGIPEYKESDLMVAEEAMEFAMEITASQGLNPGGYMVAETNNGVATFPNFVALKDGITYFIAVGAAVAPEIPKPDEEAVPKMIEIAEQYKAKVLFAPVSFGSKDPERMAQGLVLNGDEFIGTFPGFIEISRAGDAEKA